jgi:SAM-dependent methyltransferase
MKHIVSEKRWKIAQSVEKPHYSSTGEETIQLRKKRFSKYMEFIHNYPDFQLSENHMILDIGCAKYGLIHLIDKGERYCLDPLIDPSSVIITGQKLRYLAGVAESLPFKNQTFDIVITTNTLDHLRSPTAALEQVKRVLKTGGILILSVNTFAPINKLYRLFREKIGVRDLPHPFSFTRRQVEQLLKKSGFCAVVSNPIRIKAKDNIKDSLRHNIYRKLLLFLDKKIDKRISNSSEDLLFICKSRSQHQK